MGVVGQRIEKEIGQPLPGEMVRRHHTRREDETVGIDAARLGLAAQIVLHARVGVVKPEYAARHSREQPHPDVEEFRC